MTRLPPLRFRRDRLERLRTRQRLTITALARQANTSKGYVCDIANDKRAPSAQIIRRLADALGVRASYLSPDLSDEVADVPAAS